MRKADYKGLFVEKTKSLWILLLFLLSWFDS